MPRAPTSPQLTEQVNLRECMRFLPGYTHRLCDYPDGSNQGNLNTRAVLSDTTT